MTDLLALTFELQVALVAGYLGFSVGTAGLRHGIKSEDAIFQIIVYALPAAILMHLPSDVIRDRLPENRAVYLLALLSVLATVSVALLWRRWVRGAWYDWLRKRGLMAENNMPSTWDSIIQEPDTVWSQLSVTTDDDRIYHCTNTGLFADAAIELPDIDREGNVALYCDKLTLPDGTEKEQSTTRTEGWGDRLTYIPASRIRRVQLRVQRKKQKGTANTLSHLNTEDPSSPID